MHSKLPQLQWNESQDDSKDCQEKHGHNFGSHQIHGGALEPVILWNHLIMISLEELSLGIMSTPASSTDLVTMTLMHAQIITDFQTIKVNVPSGDFLPEICP